MTPDREATLGAGTKPGALSPDELSEFLARPLIARVASVRADQFPHITPMWFEWDAGRVWVISRSRSAIAEHVRENPRVCVSIASDELPYTRVTIRGHAEIMNPDGADDEWVARLHTMTGRYVGTVDSGYADRTERFPRWLIAVTPLNLTSWRGGGWAKRYLKDTKDGGVGDA
ncbi:pyridoxamine 5'-phosphate oxidase family protein [Streptosporangium sp. NPDC006007]|uniref:pyridoxamine 5'-phosphate oxidase family protein n=1 Tax=Streptosporangium sp. NPDC006007 TaxID=3154575 RepID=UPI0033B4EA1C